MFDPDRTARSLTGKQKSRLQAIAQAEKALTWEDVDDGLEQMRLVVRYSDELANPVASLGHKGWNVLQGLARQR